MAADNNITNFTAADIEKYHKGQLSAKEMHAMEKAALDDPFLADALEGYSVPGVNVSSDIAELKKRLAEETEQARVIPIASASKSNFPWFRAAVAIVLTAVAGIVAYQVLVNNGHNNEEFANTSPNGQKAESSVPATRVQETTKQDSTIQPPRVAEKTNGISGIIAKEPNTIKADETNKGSLDSISIRSDIASTGAALPGSEGNREVKQEPEVNPQSAEADKKAELYNKSNNKVEAPAGAIAKDADGVLDKAYSSKEGKFLEQANSPKRKVAVPSTNIFRGTVTDASNTPLPFANISNRRDNVGTYSDAQGNFTLVSTDTVMDVQVKSLGFENSNVQLKRFVPTNKIVLAEDKGLDARVLDTVKHNISRVRSKAMTFEEPEPEDGWPAYNSYVLNNVNMPEKIDMKKSGRGDNTVEVSFEVNEYGEPVKIRVEKSLCDQCDKEAIRLVKEGPKWKRKAKKGRRTITIPFLKTE